MILKKLYLDVWALQYCKQNPCYRKDTVPLNHAAAVSFFPIHQFITGRIGEMRDGTGLGTTFIS